MFVWQPFFITFARMMKQESIGKALTAHKFMICIGSNADKSANIGKACRLLEERLPAVVFTEPLESAPYGGKGSSYLNALAVGTTMMEISALEAELKAIEKMLGRTPADKLSGRVPIDLDLMLFDGVRYHQADWERDYVRLLLAKLGDGFL